MADLNGGGALINAPIVNTRKRKAYIGNFRAVDIRVPRDAFSTPMIFGKRELTYILLHEGSNEAQEHVIQVCLCMFDSAETRVQVGTYYASFVGSFAAQLLPSFIRPLEEVGAKIRVMSIPEQAEEAGCVLPEDGIVYGYREAVVYLGVCLILPFKNVSRANYTNFVSARIKEIGGQMGMSEEEISDLDFPIKLETAKKIRSVYAGSRNVKQEIIRFLMQAVNGGGLLQKMAKYVSTFLAFSGMNLLVFINNVFVTSRSPVLNHPAIQDEVGRFARAMILICRSSFPQYFRYFCTFAEEQLLQRQNFVILGRVAKELLKGKSRSKSLSRFAGTVKRNSLLVTDLQRLHTNYCQSMINTPGIDRANFPIPEGDYDELLDEEEDYLF